MRKWGILLILTGLLAGCSNAPAYETVADVYEELTPPVASRVMLTLPEDAAVQTMENDAGESLYLCDGYTVHVQTLAGGDLSRTLETVTGYPAERLNPIQTRTEGLKRTECVWSSLGEGQTLVGRCLILDDGNYHYAVSAMTGQAQANACKDTWQKLFASVSLDTAP